MDGESGESKLSRRGVLLAGVGLALSACTQHDYTPGASRPETPWPSDVNMPSSYRRATTVRGSVEPTPKPVVSRPQVAPSASSASRSSSSMRVLSRRQWTDAQPLQNHINPMRGVRQITVHHEGWIPVHFTDTASTVERLRTIQRVHVEDRGWADIGYHFVIDRAGRVWQARDVRYQGAHVRNHNEHNVGVMVLGNFEKQQPSSAQLQQLVVTLRSLMNQYRVPLNRVYTHQELNPTACPGRFLQPRLVSIRSNHTLA